ncbi:MAG: hypothetical protein ACI93T_001915 [Porticoccaceae bacterium]|jgi:hypothetical protein
MPVHLPAHSRRQFLTTMGTALVVGSTRVLAADQADQDLVYLLNDTHIGEKHPPTSPVPTHLRQAVTELVQRDTKAGVRADQRSRHHCVSPTSPMLFRVSGFPSAYVLC